MIDPGECTHYGEVQYKASRSKDVGGGWTDTFAPLAVYPNWWFAIETASARAMERIAAGEAAVVSTATRILQGPFHSGITTGMRIVCTETIEGESLTRTFNVTAVDNVKFANVVTRLICEEVATK